MIPECMLSTIDNPFDPFEQRDEWRMFDIEKGYYCAEYLARMVELSNDMTQNEENEAIERTIDDIILNNPLPIYKKVRRTTNT